MHWESLNVSIRIAATLTAAFVCLACTPPSTKTPALAEAGAGCAAQAARTWDAGGKAYAVAIATSGATCAEATALLTVKAPDGVVIHEETLPAAQTFGMRDAATPADMTTALQETLSSGDGMNTTAALPEWAEGVDAPGDEFPFIPEPGVDRAAYSALRAAKAPMLCYIQGGESLGCWRLDGAVMVKIGAQTFPG